jgi:hypothetical protein
LWDIFADFEDGSILSATIEETVAAFERFVDRITIGVPIELMHHGEAGAIGCLSVRPCRSSPG